MTERRAAKGRREQISKLMQIKWKIEQAQEILGSDFPGLLCDLTDLRDIVENYLIDEEEAINRDKDT